jgi:hypothetical protein
MLITIERGEDVLKNPEVVVITISLKYPRE